MSHYDSYNEFTTSTLPIKWRVGATIELSPPKSPKSAPEDPTLSPLEIFIREKLNSP